MMPMNARYRGGGGGQWYGARRAAFSLVELLTVIFIITLLIGILVPSINGARNAAKKATTGKALASIRVGLEMFKSDNEADFRLTNGYPPSFAHPPIHKDYDFRPHLGQFPFRPSESQTDQPVVYGAHWLPAMLIGVDSQGYVKRSSVPRNLQDEPWRWYTNTALEDGRILERQSLYMDVGSVRTRLTKDLPGQPPESGAYQFPDWDTMKTLPVMVDAFDQPILYYVARAHGKTTNMVEDRRDVTNSYAGGDQGKGTPFYFHEDNEGFTGTEIEEESGWDFGNREPFHGISKPGADLTAVTITDVENRDTFARYIIDRKIYKAIELNPDVTSTAPLRPVNADSFLLISAGPDGRYGSNDDVTNMPPWQD